jgi:hypothetical protein
MVFAFLVAASADVLAGHLFDGKQDHARKALFTLSLSHALTLGCDRNPMWGPMWGIVSERDPAPSRSLVIFTRLVIVILRQIWIEIIK